MLHGLCFGEEAGARNLMCFATSGCVCVRSSMRFLNLWLQIALEWLLHCEGKSLLDVALHRGRAQVLFLDNNIATASHKARTHRPGWRTAHACSFVVVLGSDS